jgi:hypothetical protein
VCISRWGAQCLDGLSFEGVQSILEGDDNKAEVEVGFMTCRLVHAPTLTEELMITLT